MILDRYHGLGNDYLVLTEGPPMTPELAQAICDRHRGVGGDGVLEPFDAGPGRYGCRIWNPDGSVAEKSGNGLRIFAQWQEDVGGSLSPMTLFTGACEVQATVGADSIAVQMGQATFDPEQIPLASAAPWFDHPLGVAGVVLRVCAVGMGNPHAVVFVTEPLDSLPWTTWGAAIEVSERFPQRTNVQFARVLSETVVEARIWERGAGATLASGSSSCAVAAAAVKTGRMPAGAITVQMQGGELGVHVHPDWAIDLDGPVERVGRIMVDEAWLAARAAGSGS